MGYRVEHLDIKEAWNTFLQYDYALIYQYSKLILRKADQIVDDDLRECTEARFFRKNAELHLLFDEDPAAVLVTDEGDDDALITHFELGGIYQTIGSELIVKQYVGTDEDGQTVIVLTRLAGIE